MLQPGQHIQDRFVVEELVGRGGLAEVYRVRHMQLGSVHALKLLSFRKRTLADRLLLEGRIQAQLRHPNVVAVTDVVRHDGQHGLLMEYVDNITLEELIDRRGKIPAAEALEIMAPVLSGVHAAHEAGVLHRDLKPANVLLAKVNGGLVPKVSDFGIAKVLDEGLDGSTRENVAMGTPGYMAPEQVLDARSVDARTDVFALAGMVYELIAGKQAFENEHGEVTLKSTLEGVVVPLTELAPDVPPCVAQAVVKGLARDREARHADVAAFASDLLGDRPELLALVLGAGQRAPLTLDPSRPSRFSDPGTSTAEEGSVGGGPTLLPPPGTVMPARQPSPTFDGGRVAQDSVPPTQSSKRSPPLFWTGALLALGLVLLGGTVGLLVAGPALGVWSSSPGEADVGPGLSANAGVAGSVRIRDGVPIEPLQTPEDPENPPDDTTPTEAGTPESGRTASGAGGTAGTGGASASEPGVAAGGPDSGSADGDAAVADVDLDSDSDSDPDSDPDVDGEAGTDTDAASALPDAAAAGGDAGAQGTADGDGGNASTVSEATPAPEPDPEPERPMIMPMDSLLTASWDGKVYRQPLTLRILQERAGDVVAEGRIVIGAQQRILRLAGRYDPYTGALYLKETNGSLILKGTVSGRMISGTYQREGKGSPERLELMRR